MRKIQRSKQVSNKVTDFLSLLHAGGGGSGNNYLQIGLRLMKFPDKPGGGNSFSNTYRMKPYNTGSIGIIYEVIKTKQFPYSCSIGLFAFSGKQQNKENEREC